MKMKFLFFLEFVFIFTKINGNESPYLMVPREQDMKQSLSMPKTIIINAKNGQINTEDPNVMQAVMNAVNNQMKNGANNGKDFNGNEVPDVIFTDSESQLDQGMGSPFENFQKVYNLPTTTRMIASEEETDGKKGPMWRSPLPFLHSDNCPMHHKGNKKSKSSRKKARKQSTSVRETAPTTTVKPLVEDTENREPLSSILSSIFSNSVFPSLPEQEREVNEVNEVRAPTSFLMSISRHIRPEASDFPIISKPKTHGIIAILHKRREPLPVPEPQFMAPIAPPMPPFNPFLDLLSKLQEPTEQKVDLYKGSEPKDMEEDKEGKANYNFNVNLTINNFNYPESAPKGIAMPHFPLGF